MTSKLLNKFPIPENFPDILHDFAKEVVREQPKDILDFAVEYFKALETGTPLDYGHKHEKLNSCDTNELATNPATKTNFDIKREDKPKEEIDNNSIEEKEGQQSNQSGSSSSNKSEESHNESVSQKNDNEEQNKAVIKVFNDAFGNHILDIDKMILDEIINIKTWLITGLIAGLATSLGNKFIDKMVRELRV